MMEEHRKEEFLKEEQRKEEMRREERFDEQKKLEEKRIEDIRKVDEEEFRKETDSPRRSITPNAANGKFTSSTKKTKQLYKLIKYVIDEVSF